MWFNLLSLLAAMMSEDSDYTSDINYPLQHQNNCSAHQLPREQHPFRHRQRDDRSDSYDSREYHTANDAYEDSFDRVDENGGGGGHASSFESRDGYPPEEEEEDAPGYDDRAPHRYYGYREAPYRGRSDTDSEPLFYNSRPQSFNRLGSGWLAEVPATAAANDLAG